MKDRNNSDYEKALKLYNTGYINKAINLCEKSLSRNLGNPNLINLKGLLLYLQGNLEDAISLWKINEYNNDAISRSYLKDVKMDFERYKLYKKSEELMEEFEIDEAVDILMACRESDFNLINVNNALAVCYMKKGNYNLSKELLKKVLEIDKNNIKAKHIEKEINEVLNIKNVRSMTLKIMLVLAIGVFTIVSFGFKANWWNKINGINKEISNVENKEEEINNEIDEETIITKDILNNNSDIMRNSEISDKSSLTAYEISENYIKAVSLFKEGKYKESKEVLQNTIIYSEEHHLYDDIMFFLASSNEKLNNEKEAIKYFEKYISIYENGNYIEESYYKICLLYNEIDKEKSKYYASNFINRYPESIYNNNNIKAILKN